LAEKKPYVIAVTPSDLIQMPKLSSPLPGSSSASDPNAWTRFARPVGAAGVEVNKP
jgi:hypothetical protein